jgi:Flp pilus assembly protein TadG
MAIVEFALVFPLLLLIMFAIIQYGWLLNNVMILNNAAGTGAAFFSTQFDSSTARGDTLTVVRAAAAAIDGNDLQITTRVNGTVCNDPGCGSRLTENQGTPASVTVTWTITPIFNLVISGLPGFPANVEASISYRVPSAF